MLLLKRSTLIESIESECQKYPRLISPTDDIGVSGLSLNVPIPFEWRPPAIPSSFFPLLSSLFP